MANQMYPVQVEVNEQNVLKITNTFKSAYKDILSEINTATDFGVQNRKAILAQIEGILTELGTNVKDFLEEEIPGYYEQGSEQAVKQLKNVGADVNVSEGFNRIHKEAIFALVDDTTTAFGTALSGVARSASNILGKATREIITQKMAKGVISGESLSEVRKAIKGVIQEQGLSALVDKAGRNWTLDRYADTLFRTKVVEARNRGLANRMVQNEYDLVQVSNHMTDHEECAFWEGKILSLTGQTKGYPTVAQAERAGLFHPNCKHAINVLIPRLAKMTSAYDPATKTRVISNTEAQNITDDILD